MTDAAHYADSTFTGSTGVFFLTTPKTEESGSKNLYTEKSAAQSVTNENAQDIDVTVKLEQKTAGSEGVAYSNTATFETSDTANKLYLAVTDDAESNAKVSALSATTAATVSATVSGKPANYKPAYDSTKGYGYVLKTKAENGDQDLTWNSCSFILTGALNKNATWGDDVTFPAIKVEFLENRKELERISKCIIFTGTIDSYFGYCFGELEYRSLRFETERINKANYQGVAVMNYTDRETPYTRIIEHKHFEFGMQPTTVISREYPESWDRDKEPYYPINDEKNDCLYQKYIEKAKEDSSVIFGGRLGSYKYYDMQDTIKAALTLARKLT